MPADGVVARLVLDLGDGDDELVERELQYLLVELGEADVGDVTRVRADTAPAGTKGGGSVEIGALLIALGGAGATLPTLIALLQDWLGRRRSATVRIKIGDDELELTQASDAMRQRVLDEFLRRHGK